MLEAGKIEERDRQTDKQTDKQKGRELGKAYTLTQRRGKGIPW